MSIETGEFSSIKDAAYAEAATFALPPDWEEGRQRTLGLTVDSWHTRDRDDAIMQVELPGTRRLLTTSISDVGSFLMNSPAITDYAQHMGETRYLRTGNLTMIPPRISEGILSILDDKREGGRIAPTPVISTHLMLESDNTIGGLEITRDSMFPRAMTYGQVAARTQGKGPEQEVDRMREYEKIAHRLLHQRQEHGAFAVYDQTRGLMTDEDGNIISFPSGGSRAGELIVQEFMILTNSAIAEYMMRHNIPALYRNHHLRADASQQNLAKLLSGEDLSVKLLQSVYARARYSPTPEGHIGLNLPAYMHFTSPLRRFADFVNHANLVAHLENREYPFPAVLLGPIAEHLNAVQDEVRFGRRTAAARVISVARAAEEGRRTRTATTAGGTALRAAVSETLTLAKLPTAAEGSFPDELVTQARERLANDKLTPAEMAPFLLRKFNNNQVDDELITEILTRLASNPTNATAILNHIRQLGVVKNYVHREKALPGGGFSSEAMLYDANNQIVCSASAQAASKQVASQQAALRLLEETSGGSLPPNTLSDDPVLATVNYKGILQEALARRGKPLPDYEIVPTDTGFQSTVTVRVDGKEFSFIGTAPTQRGAEQNAARAAQEQLQFPKLPPRPNTPNKQYGKRPSKPEIKQDQKANPVTQLQNLAFEWHGNVFGTDNTTHLPRYDFHWKNTDSQSPLFECIVTVELADGSFQQFTAEDGSKVKAKRAAAEAAIRALKSEDGNK